MLKRNYRLANIGPREPKALKEMPQLQVAMQDVIETLVAAASGIGPLVALLKDHPLRMVSHRATQVARAPAWKGCCRLSATSGLVKTYRDRNCESEGLEADVRAVVSDLIRAAQEAEAARISADLPLEPSAA